MKRIIALLYIMLVVVCAFSQELTLVWLDGSAQTEALKTVGRLELTNGGTSYVLRANGTADILSEGRIADLARISFLDEDKQQDNNPTALDFTIEKTGVVAQGGDVVLIYSLGGKLIRRQTDGRIPTEGLSRGVYIVVSGTRVAKIVVK